jgi:hypothetical protein
MGLKAILDVLEKRNGAKNTYSILVEELQGKRRRKP